MSNNDQMALEFPEVCIMEEQWPVLLGLVRHVAVEVGRKQIAHDLDLSRSVLDNILLDRDRHSLKAKHLVYLLLRDRSGQVLKMLAGLTGNKVEPKIALTPGQKVRAYERAIRQRLGDFGQEILDKALEEAGR